MAILNYSDKNFILNRAGLVTVYILVPAALSLGLVGGFFLSQGIFFPSSGSNFSHAAIETPSSSVSGDYTMADSLLGSAIEVFDRAVKGKKVPRETIISFSEPLETKESSTNFISSATNSSISAIIISTTTVTKKKSVPEEKAVSISDCPFFASSTYNQGVFINELAWMGSVPESGENAAVASRKEWIELFNNSSRTISLSGWQIRDEIGKFSIIFPEGARIQGQGFYLLKRGSQEKISGNNPDLIYSSTLSNSGMKLRMLDGNCRIVDDVDAATGWPAGNAETKQTLERNENGIGWHTSTKTGGTPREKNSVIFSLPSGGGGLATGFNSGEKTSLPSSSPVIYPKILINEIQIDSPSSTREEFVELYNPNQSAVDLNGWYMQKTTKSGNNPASFASKNLFSGKKILAHSFLVIANPSSSFAFSLATDEGLSDSNTLILKDPDGGVVDKVGWGEASNFEGNVAPTIPTGESIQRRFIDGYFIDTDMNGNDFEVISCPSPEMITGECNKVGLLAFGVDEVTASSSIELSGAPVVASSSINETSTTDQVPSSSTVELTDYVATTTSLVATSTLSTSSIISLPFIYEVQTTGGPGKTDNDFIKIMNQATSAADISGWRLRKKTQSGTESSIKVFTDGSLIPPSGIFAWFNSKDGYSELADANVSSTANLADNNSIGLFNSSGVLIDALAWGNGHTDPFIEGSAFSENPGQNQVIRRKISDGVMVDTDNNSSDFSLVLTIY